jgi:transposase-like protein
MVTAMSPAKLSDADKQTMVDLYRQTPATTSTLAERFGVSNSTISRLLKNALSTSEYEALIQEKRSVRGSKAEAQLSLSLMSPESDESPSLPSPSQSLASPAAPNTRGKRRRTRSTTLSTEPPIENAAPPEAPPALSPPLLTAPGHQFVSAQPPALSTSTPGSTNRPQIVAIKSAALDEIVKDIDEDFDNEDDDLEDDLEDLEEDEELDDDEDDLLEEAEPIMMIGKHGKVVSVKPFRDAVLPKSCYLVIDRLSELIVRPLKELTPNGTIPETEVRQKTLPIFDNHRVARRFSLRTQRVIKIPDSELFRKTTHSLKAKGITRIFLDGQVYTL